MSLALPLREIFASDNEINGTPKSFDWRIEGAVTPVKD
jgi:C1A family cysteine protease